MCQLLCIPETVKDLFVNNDYLWTFDGILSNFYPPAHLVGGATMVNDRNLNGAAVSLLTDVPGSVSLGDFGTDCLTDPSICGVGFMMSLWLRCEESQDGFVFSSGAQDAGKLMDYKPFLE